MINAIKTLENKLNIPSPLQPLNISQSSDYQVFIKRDDLIHPYISGNKWRKLKYNLDYYLLGSYDGIISLGGSFSNHLVALAVVCHMLKIPCLGFVRARHSSFDNPSLKICRQMGMKLVSLHPDDYSQRSSIDLCSRQSSFASPFFIPEGGSNDLNIKGCQEMLDELNFVPDYIVIPIGTGGTATALIKESTKTEIIGVSPFKKDKVVIPFESQLLYPHKIIYNYALNGYGRYNKSLVDYINNFWIEHGIALDPIYNGKGMMGLESMIDNRYFKSGSKILYVNTGGLQGITGFNMVHGQKTRIIIPEEAFTGKY